MLEAEVTLENGTIITLDRVSSVTEAVALRAGRILATGSTAGLARYRGPRTRRIDLRGRTVVPGLFDAHPRIDRLGLKAGGGISIVGLRSVAEIVDVVRRAARSARPDEWIVLTPMGNPPHDYVSRPEELREGRFPTRHDLDVAAPGHPVYIRAVWGGWAERPCPSVASSRALAQARVTRRSGTPHNVEIVRDGDGEPTGVFLERNRIPVVEHIFFGTLPGFTRADLVAGVRGGLQLVAAAGTTAGFEACGLTPAVVSAYREVHGSDEPTPRLHAPFSVPSATYDDAQLAQLFHEYRTATSAEGVADHRLRVEGINLGGPPDVRLAALIASGYPYEQWAGHFYQSLGADRFTRLGRDAASLGLRASATAGPMLEEAISRYEAVHAHIRIDEWRWVIDQVGRSTAFQRQRMQRLGVVVTAIPGVRFMTLGVPERGAVGAPPVRLREYLDAGIPIALGTAGVAPSMLWTMWAALTDRHDTAERALTREEALRLVAQSGHRLTWSEARRGSLEAGKDADLVVLGGNPLTCPIDDIKDLPVDLTIVGGRTVHDTGSLVERLP